jgi:hypothetical protein
MRSILTLAAGMVLITTGTSRAEILEGPSTSDTILYGELVARYTAGGCTAYIDLGPGICVFVMTASYPYRGAFRDLGPARR